MALALGVFLVNGRSHVQWLVHSFDTSVMGREAEQFAVVNNLFQIIEFLTCTLNRTGDSA